MKRGAKGKFEYWLKPENLAQITNWAAKGLTNEEIYNNMGISYNTFYQWLQKYYEINEALKTGRSMSVVALENTAFKLATGQCEEEVMVKTKDKDGNEIVKVQKRRLPPNTAMLIFLLKNRAGYRDNPPEDNNSELLNSVDSVLVSIKRAAENAQS